MKFTPRQYASALHKAISETDPKHHDAVLNNFVDVLKEQNALNMVDSIEEEFLAYEREAKGIKLAEVTTAKQMSEAEQKKLIRELNDYVGGKVELKTKIDEEQLGGIVVRIGDELIDGSTRKSLQDLKNELIK